ncbi:hypothetical protein Aeh1ORF099c [Aeromonas phage Aeh1]|uniref:Uncharacterized protein n=1 Tax=Aeromonas phage Aeh1 TaxID=2880362 RepID=Q76YY6_9CAUD|nr:hypothetical protein Aeh1p105 [Aeromonas phage Aeh1]AAQ17760.1 hypothetical protein Aeh1ORF099c [Aeromonas phage Aeh1]
MLVTKKSQIQYEKILYVVSVMRQNDRLTASCVSGKVVAIHDRKTTIQLTGTGRFREIFYGDFNVTMEGAHYEPYNVNRVFNTEHEAMAYVNRLNNMELTKYESVLLHMDSNVELKYAVFYHNEIRQMPIEIRDHKVYSNNTRETREIDDKTWYCDHTETRHSFKRTDNGNECDVSDKGIKIFVDPHKAIDFYLGK